MLKLPKPNLPARTLFHYLAKAAIDMHKAEYLSLYLSNECGSQPIGGLSIPALKTGEEVSLYHT
jgi:hypothetical protein